jgi:hypothetical protein
MIDPGVTGPASEDTVRRAQKRWRSSVRLPKAAVYLADSPRRHCGLHFANPSRPACDWRTSSALQVVSSLAEFLVTENAIVAM